MFLVILPLVYLCYFYFKEWYGRKYLRYPPGPWPIPLFGNSLQMAIAASEPHLVFQEFSKRYGEIYRVNAGYRKEIVICSSFEGIKEIFTNDAASGRDIKDGILNDRQLGRNLGIILSSGTHWEIMRAFSMSKLKDQGFGKTAQMDCFVKEELAAFLSHLESLEDERGIVTKQIHETFEVPVLKTFWRMLVGEIIDVKDEEMTRNLMKKSSDMAKSGILGAGLLSIFPFFKYLIPGLTGYTVAMEFIDFGRKIAKDLLRDRVKEIKEASTYGENKGLLDAYAAKIIKGDQPEIFSEDDWAIVFMDVIQASTDTTASFMECLLLFSTLYPEVQQKIWEELRQVVPEGEEIYYSHFKKMTYLQAVYLEVHRHCKIFQHLVPRRALSDFRYKGYIIKKNTVIMPDLYTTYANPKTFPDPSAFKPERFLDPSGQIVNGNLILPFGIGKRVCPGNFFAEKASFLLFTGIIDKYQLNPATGEKRPRQDMQVGYASRPFPFKVEFTRR